MVVGDTLCRAARVQAARVANRGGVLIIADADDDCAVDLAGRLRSTELIGQAKPAHVEIAIAVREFEAWFLTTIESLRAHPAVRSDATYDDDPELPRGAKSSLNARMTESYKETLHQPSFDAIMDLGDARRTRSFAHLVTCVERLLTNAAQP